jgi:hypothetical protein
VPTVRIDLTLDCADATVLAAFWKQALGYEDEPPPAPYTTRQQWADSFGPAEAAAWLQHPSGTGALPHRLVNCRTGTCPPPR